MRRLITAILLLVFWPGIMLGQRTIFFSQNHHVSVGGAAATVVGGCSTLSSTDSASVSCTITGVTAGELIVVEYNFFDNHTITLTDSNTYGAIASVPLISGSYPLVWNSSGIFYDYVSTVTDTSSGTHVLTATDASTPGSPPWIQAILVSGASTTSPVDSASALASASANTITGTSVTTSSANELLLTFCALKSNGDAISISNTPQTMTSLQNPAVGILAASSIAVTPGSNYTQCIDTNSYGDEADINVVAIH